MTPYPFPWPAGFFFNTFPETVYEDVDPIKPIAMPANTDFDLVIVGYSVWFLSPGTRRGSRQAGARQPEARETAALIADGPGTDPQPGHPVPAHVGRRFPTSRALVSSKAAAEGKSRSFRAGSLIGVDFREDDSDEAG